MRARSGWERGGARTGWWSLITGWCGRVGALRGRPASSREELVDCTTTTERWTPPRSSFELLRRQMVGGRDAVVGGGGSFPETGQSDSPRRFLKTMFRPSRPRGARGRWTGERGSHPIAPRARGVAAARSFLEGRQAPPCSAARGGRAAPSRAAMQRPRARARRWPRSPARADRAHRPGRRQEARRPISKPDAKTDEGPVVKTRT